MRMKCDVFVMKVKMQAQYQTQHKPSINMYNVSTVSLCKYN